MSDGGWLVPGPVDLNGEELRQFVDAQRNELDPLAKHGHRPKHRASLRHPSLEMKIMFGVGLGVVAGVVLVQVLW